MNEPSQTKTRSVGLLAVVGLLTTGLPGLALPASANVCAPSINASADCGLGLDCPQANLAVQEVNPLCDSLNQPLADTRYCEPQGVTVPWVLEVHLDTYGLRDKAIGMLVCVRDSDGDGELDDKDALAGCVADWFTPSCYDDGTTSGQGTMECRLFVIDELDLVTATAHIVCYDPADPLNVLPTVVEVLNELP